MNNLKLMLTTTAAVVMATSAAHAVKPTSKTNFYNAYTIGAGFLNETEEDKSPTIVDLDYDEGLTLSAALGYRPQTNRPYLNHMRYELELGYSYNSIDSITTTGGVTSPKGHTQAFSLMANALYDFDTAYALTPYVGAGVGAATVEIYSGPAGIASQWDEVFAYQFMAGLAYTPQMLPQTAFSLGYRFKGMQNPNFTSVELEDYMHHTVELGMRYHF